MYDHRSPILQDFKNYRNRRQASPGEQARLHQADGLGFQISKKFRLLSDALAAEDIPAGLRAAKQRQLDLERMIEIQALQTRKSCPTQPHEGTAL